MRNTSPLMNADDFGTLASAVLGDFQRCQHLREAPDEIEFWRRLEAIANELNLHPDFETMRASARSAFTFWFMHWNGGGMA